MEQLDLMRYFIGEKWNREDRLIGGARTEQKRSTWNMQSDYITMS
jgi:hypothetical protein